MKSIISLFALINFLDLSSALINPYSTQLTTIANELSLPITSEASTLPEWSPSTGEYEFTSDYKNSKSALLTRSDLLLEKSNIDKDHHAQHSLGLLYYSGYGGVNKNNEESIKYHLLASLQGNLDALAIIGSCLRKGNLGLNQDISLGIEMIEYSASQSSVFGLIKYANLLEMNDNHHDNMKVLDIYEESSQIKNTALGLFNYAYILYHHDDKSIRNRAHSEELWRSACSLITKDGADEAAYHLSIHLGGVDDQEGRKYMGLAATLGMQEAQKELSDYKKMIESYFD